MFKIFLVTEASGANFSVEAGIHDGKMNFDHHRSWSGNPAPCSPDCSIEKGIAKESVIEITHIDADTLIGLAKLTGNEVADLKLYLGSEAYKEIEAIDLNGSSAASSPDSDVLAFMVGVNEFAKEIKFPRPIKGEEIDVSWLVAQMFNNTYPDYLALGKAAIKAAEEAYNRCRQGINSKIGFWSISATDPLDPSRAYRDGIDIVIVYRDHYKSISIYANPVSSYEFSGKEIAGVKFAGHPKACGSPRGEEMTHEIAHSVFLELCKTMYLMF